MVRTVLVCLLLPAFAVGCGEPPASHRVERRASDVAKPTAGAEARAMPPRAIATH